MRENEERERWEEQREEQRKKEQQKEKEEKGNAEWLLAYYKQLIKEGKATTLQKQYVKINELYNNSKMAPAKFIEPALNIRNKYRNEIIKDVMKTNIKQLARENKITTGVETKFIKLLDEGNYLQFKTNIQDGKTKKYEELFVKLYDLQTLRDTSKICLDEFEKQKNNIYNDLKKICINEKFDENKKTTSTPVSTNQSSIPKTTIPVSTNQSSIPKTTIPVSTNQSSIPKTTSTSQPNSLLNNIGNGYVASAQARVNAVNLVASVVTSGASAVGNAYVQGSNDMANTRRMEAQARRYIHSI
jgi:hypothetical protein